MTEPSPYTTPEAEVELPLEGKQTRKSLVPTWIKVFAWIFVVFGALIPLLMIFTIATNTPIQLALFGLEYNGPATNGWAALISGLYVFLGVSALGLLLERDWGLDACIANGIVGAIICIVVMVLTDFTNLRVELLVQLFYLRRLFVIRPMWQSAPSSTPEP